MKKRLKNLSVPIFCLSAILGMGQLINGQYVESESIETFYSQGYNEGVKKDIKKDDNKISLKEDLKSEDIKEENMNKNEEEKDVNIDAELEGFNDVKKEEEKEVFVNKDNAKAIEIEDGIVKTETRLDIFTPLKIIGFNDQYAKVILNNNDNNNKNITYIIDHNFISENINYIFKPIDNKVEKYVSEDTKILYEPNDEAEEFHSNVNDPVLILGENNNNFVKIEFKGDIFYTRKETLNNKKKKLSNNDYIKETKNKSKKNNTNNKTIKKKKPIKKIKTKPFRGSGIEMNVPKHRDFKAYMDYRTITNRSSLQYKLQQSSKTTTKNGFRMYDGKYMIALGSYWGRVGEEVQIELKNGTVLNCIIGDQKADIHTDAKNQFHLSDGSFLEFIVDTNTLSSRIKTAGNCSYATHDRFNSPAIKIRK